MAEVNPLYVLDINTRLESLITGNWQRAVKHAGAWGKVMKARPGQGKLEILTWLLDTVGIYPQGNGGKMRFDDMTALQTEIVITNFGSGLRLTSNEVKDNQLEKNPKVGAMDYADKWARDRGAEGVLFPRKNMFSLIGAGGTATTYDGLSFFNTAHPIDPGKPSGATFSNILDVATVGGSCDISVTGSSAGSINDLATAGENLGRALGYIGSLTFNAAGTPRYLVPRGVLVPTTLDYRARQLLGVSSDGAFGGGNAGAELISMSSNVLESYGLDVISAPEVNTINTTNSTPNAYYIYVEDTISDELGALIMSEREAFELQGYPDVSSARANRSQMWEWNLIGRYGFQYGHPYLLFQVLAS
jgi:hypothetical protein